MRLALLAPWPPLRGGIAQHSVALAAAARRRGHAVHVVTFRRLYPRILFPGRSQVDPDALPPPDVPVSAVLDALRPGTWRAGGRALRRERPDVLLVQCWHPFFAPALARAARVAREGGARVAWMFHNVLPHEARWFPWQRLAVRGVAPADLCLAHSRSVAAEIRRLLPGARIRCRPMPAHPEPGQTLDRSSARAALGVGSAGTVFLCFGHVRAYKGLDVFLAALERLPDGPQPWRALVVGEWYVDRTGLQERIARLGERLTIVDRYLPESEISLWFAAADVVVAPHRSATQSGCVPLAFAHDRPVVVSDVGGLAEAVVEGASGFVVPPADPLALAGALQRVLAGHSFSPDAIRAARRGASWEPLLEDLETLARGGAGGPGDPSESPPRGPS